MAQRLAPRPTAIYCSACHQSPALPFEVYHARTRISQELMLVFLSDDTELGLALAEPHLIQVVCHMWSTIPPEGRDGLTEVTRAS